MFVIFWVSDECLVHIQSSHIFSSNLTVSLSDEQPRGYGTWVDDAELKYQARRNQSW